MGTATFGCTFPDSSAGMVTSTGATVFTPFMIDPPVGLAERYARLREVTIKITAENVVILPHLGSATIEARSAMAELAVKNVINVLKGKKALTPVY